MAVDPSHSLARSIYLAHVSSTYIGGARTGGRKSKCLVGVQRPPVRQRGGVVEWPASPASPAFFTLFFLRLRFAITGLPAFLRPQRLRLPRQAPNGRSSRGTPASAAWCSPYLRKRSHCLPRRVCVCVSVSAFAAAALPLPPPDLRCHCRPSSQHHRRLAPHPQPPPPHHNPLLALSPPFPPTITTTTPHHGFL